MMLLVRIIALMADNMIFYYQGFNRFIIEALMGLLFWAGSIPKPLICVKQQIKCEWECQIGFCTCFAGDYSLCPQDKINTTQVQSEATNI